LPTLQQTQGFMKRPQWITFGFAILLVIGLYAGTKSQLFGEKNRKTAVINRTSEPETITIDTILFHAKENLSKEQVSRLNQLENSISRGDVFTQKLHLYHQLANFWKDTARYFAPFAWYTAEAARLENSEKSLTFAARLFLEGLKNEDDPHLKQWEAVQAKDLFERSLKINPANDSSKVNLGAVYLYGGMASPMEGIRMIKDVAEKDSTNIHAQMTLGEASMVSGQMEKAIDRFKTVVRLQPDNLEAIFRVAEINEQMHNKAEAIEWYKKSFPFIKMPGLKHEVEKRINQLNQ
jgi:tetratricopeptide (TPR) repeat protein